MRVKPLIDRLKANASTLGGRIAGAAEFSDAVQATQLALPCAFVIRAGGSADPNIALGRVVQLNNEEFGVVIAVSNASDERGQAGTEALDDILTDVLNALLGWAPDTSHNAFEFVRDDHVGMDRARLWHQMQFRTSSAIG